MPAASARRSRSLGRSVVRAAFVLGVTVSAGCGEDIPTTLGDVATSVEWGFENDNIKFTVTPWPLDTAFAFLCLEKPGSEFTGTTPVPAVDAGCAQTHVAIAGDRLIATYVDSELNPALGQAFGGHRGPWYLAVAGARGPLSTAVVLNVLRREPTGPGSS